MANRAAWVSLIFGILAFVLAPFGALSSLVAIVAGVLGRKKKKDRGIATIGLVLGIVWWALLIIMIVTGSLNRFLRTIGL